jgi:hypothetical protein
MGAWVDYRACPDIAHKKNSKLWASKSFSGKVSQAQLCVVSLTVVEKKY